ncbi:MAG TPA: methyltransferase domain-containing protein [Polyangia bacterium]|jgi:2-polyprenyl-3-methyl-5-hydroxy-6-metoxy-1,4-benzoquinol methylase|nr:methyltransferase domain-containing protein [Polyangia bacterium]
METRTANFFDQYAGDFSAIYGNDHTPVNAIVNRLFRKSMMLRYERTLAGCNPIQGKTVIDIGCGPGHYSVALAERGAARVLGVDFASGMIDIAKQRAQRANVSDRCTFTLGDFLEVTGDEKFDYAVVMGFMDYIEDPKALMEKVLRVCRGKAFFSFPADGGVLAWQRRMRYKSRCALYLYNEAQIRSIVASLGVKGTVEPISRDYFVTLTV